MLKIYEKGASSIEWADKIHIKSLSRTFNKLSNEKSGRTQSGYMRNFLIGSYLTYEMEVCPNPDTDPDQVCFNNLWELLAKKCPTYRIEMPYNNGVIRFDAYITSASQQLRRISRKRKKVVWDSIKIVFVSNNPCLASFTSSTAYSYSPMPNNNNWGFYT